MSDERLGDVRPATPGELAALEEDIDAWLAEQQATNPVIAAVERGERDERRWYVRMQGEERDVFTIWLTLRQRSLHHETYFMPAPRENHAELFEVLLRRNAELRGVCFAVGAEDAVYLVGQIPIEQVQQCTVDVVLGTHYEAVERFFPLAMRIGYASVFQR